MSNRPNANTRVTVDIPTVNHKKLKMLAAFHGKTMRDIFVEILEHGLERYPECPKSHEPNETTKQVIEDVRNRKNLEKIDDIKELLKKLSN